MDERRKRLNEVLLAYNDFRRELQRESPSEIVQHLDAIIVEALVGLSRLIPLPPVSD